MKMTNRRTNIIAVILLIFVFLVTIFSMKDDSMTMDEQAHLPAGYSYLTQRDMRLNPEHPPLIKDLAALPLLFINGIEFPHEIKDWQEDVNGQWGFGSHFMYEMGNPADQMLFWGRIPMVLILILLGFYIFKWTKELFGNNAAIFSLFLFSFSPTFLAHGRLVTTDVGAAAGALIATYYFIKFLQNSSKKNLIIAGIILGFAQLAKFSLFLLLPAFGILIMVWSIIKAFDFKSFWKTFGLYLARFILILLISAIVISLIYAYNIWNYPVERQISDIKTLHQGKPIPFLTEGLMALSKIPVVGKGVDFFLNALGPASKYLTDLSEVLTVFAKNRFLRPFGQYLHGLSLVIQRGLGGHTTFFLGEVSAVGWKNYFPIVYILKEPLAFHILTIIALILASILIKEPFWRNTITRIEGWIKLHFPEFAMLIFIAVYWISSISSPLNIGVRHLLPVFPFTFLLVSAVITNWLKSPPFGIKYLIIGVLVVWQIISVIKIYPHFLAYFNEIAGGPDQGYLYTVNSNLDWGQDLKRLKKWVDDRGLDRIYIDYFGGSDTRYHFKEKCAPWWGTRNPAEFPKGNYLAVSATFLQGGRGDPVPGFNQDWGHYRWLNQYEPPVDKIGYSIFIYYID